MKTLTDIKKIMLDISNDQPRGWKKRYKELMEIKMYIESFPSSEFINKELDRLQNRFYMIIELQPEPAQGSDYKNPEFKKIFKKWEDENDLPKLKKQIKNLKFILS